MHQGQSDKTKWREFPTLLIRGFLMGSADIVPGVSGGTMALIVGIYNRLVHAIKSFDGVFLKNLFTLKVGKALDGVHWRFMVMLLAGILLAILFFTKVVALQVYMFTDPELIYGIFFGLIVGSVFILWKELEPGERDYWTYLWVVLGTGIGYWVVTLVPADTPESPLFVFISGAIAICAMILPGISGSYILLILRKYDFILSEVGNIGTGETVQGLVVLLPFIAGAVFGLAAFSRLLSWLLDHYYTKTLAVLIGFLVGSLYVIWPYQDREYTEIVRDTRVVEYTSEEARHLRENPEAANRPEYHRLGDIVAAGGGENTAKLVEIVTVRKKLIQTEPYIPYVTVSGARTGHFWAGVGGMTTGLLLVILLDYLRDRK